MKTFYLPLVQRGLKVALLALALGSSGLSMAADSAGETVTIRHDGQQTYYEYRVNGEVVEIKVVPKVGPSYYLIPSDNANGDFVRKDNPEIRVPSWVIFRW